MRLFYGECKKIFTSRMHLILLLLFAMISIAFFQYHVNDNRFSTTFTYHFENGSEMSQSDMEAVIAQEKQQWSGEMDAAWWQRLQQAYPIAMKRSDEHFYDFERMAKQYGANWYEDYRQHKEKYRYEDDEQELAQGERILYQRNVQLPWYEQDLKDGVVISLYLNYGKMMMEDQPWHMEETQKDNLGEINQQQIEHGAYTRINLTNAELRLLESQMDSIASFHYGDSKNWMIVLDTLPFIGIFVSIWMILISSSIINEEHKFHMMETLRTCKKGSHGLFWAKAGAVMSSGILVVLLLNGCLLLYAKFSGNLGDASVNISEGLHAISIFTYGQSMVLSLLFMGLGACAIGAVGLLLSAIIPSSYLSLALTFLLLYVPNTLLDMMTGNINDLWPVSFIRVEDVTIHNFTISFGEHAELTWHLLLWIWPALLLLLVLIAWRIFQHRRYHSLT